MQIKTLFVDLDDTVYPPESGLWELIKHRISLYMHEKLNLDWDTIPQMRSAYYKNYGTTMRGLMADYEIDKEEYLRFVHDVPLGSYISNDQKLRGILQGLPQRKIIFTNADIDHARRVLNILGITDCFEMIIDIYAMFPYCKPLPDAFQIAMKNSGETLPGQIAFLDDSVTNLAAAKQMGFYSIRVGSNEPGEHYDAAIYRLQDICKVIPC
jgi:putative hydrolase of the HAD superfamily